MMLEKDRSVSKYRFARPRKKATFITARICCALAAMVISGSLIAQKSKEVTVKSSLSMGEELVNVGFGNPDMRYSQYWLKPDEKDHQSDTQEGKIKLADRYSLFAWKGERVFMQLLFQAGDTITGLQITPQDLRILKEGSGSSSNSGGAAIEASQVKIGFVRYVLSNGIGKSGNGCGLDTAIQHLANIDADGIEYAEKTNVSAGKNQPVWISVKVPEDAVAGTYQGTLSIRYSVADGKVHKQNLPYQLQVENKVLPQPKNWKFHLDLWQYPESIARWYKVKPWSKEHFEKMRPYMQMLADAGQKVITTSIINDPWNGQTYDPYSSMIKWTKNKDGSWKYDYTIFDKWVSFMMGLGIDKEINCYSMVPWHNTFTYFDAASGSQKKFVAKAGTPEYNQFWKGMLEDFANHLIGKGWFDKTCIAMDERPLQDMEKVIRLIKGLPHPFKLSLAGSYHKTLDQDIYDYSITTREHYDQDVLDRRLKAGLPTTYYTCCTEDHPNTFSFSPPAEAAFIPLLSASRNLNGYLRWAYNAWPAHPLTDSRFGSWPSGDTYFVYPGPGSSIRYEQLIRGIQDFEKIRIIKADLKARNNVAGLQKLDKALQDITVKKLREAGAAPLVRDVEEVINQF